jgi:hypothetical protein
MGKKIIRLTESDLARIVKRVLIEQEMGEEKSMGSASDSSENLTIE